MNNKGAILIISLWILAIISLLCLSLAHQVVVNLKLVGFQKDKIKCLYIVKAAIQKSISVLDSDNSRDLDTLNELSLAGCNFEENNCLCSVSDEDRKANINLASKEFLVALFSMMQTGDPLSLAENIIYWRGDSEKNYKDPYYESQAAPYAARESYLRNMEELSLINGFRDNPKLIKECEIFFTVYTKDNFININTASPQIIKAVLISLGAEDASPGLSDRLADSIIDYRNGTDNEDCTDDDVAIAQDEIKKVLKADLIDLVEIGWVDKQILPFKANSDFFMIDVSVGLNKSKIHKKVAAVADRSKKPPKIIYWHEE